VRQAGMVIAATIIVISIASAFAITAIAAL
jgi:hypothetical protein